MGDSEKYQDLGNKIFDEIDKKSGVEIFGQLVGKGERLINIGAANYFTGIFSAGGKLLLTDQNLYFRAHAVNVGRKECKIALSEIVEVEIALNLLISQHLVIYTNSDSHRFVVFHGKQWLENIKKAMANLIKNLPLLQ